MKSTSNAPGTKKTFIPALLGISLTLGSVWGIHAAYGAPKAEPQIVVVETPPSQAVVVPPMPTPPAPTKPVVATAPSPVQAPAPQPAPAPAKVTPATPTVKKTIVVVTPSRRTRAS